MFVALLEKIKSPEWKAFAFRMYNTFKTIVLPIVLSMVYLELQNNPDDIACLLSGVFWLKVAYAVIVAVIGSALAGIDKITRMK